MVFRMESTYGEIESILETNCIPTSFSGYTFPSVIYELTDNHLLLETLLPDEVKVKSTIDDIRLTSKLTTNKTKRFTENSFL